MGNNTSLNLQERENLIQLCDDVYWKYEQDYIEKFGKPSEDKRDELNEWVQEKAQIDFLKYAVELDVGAYSNEQKREIEQIMGISFKEVLEYKEVMEAVKQNGFSLVCASDRLKDDKEVVFEAIEHNGRELFNDLIENKDILNAARQFLIDTENSMFNEAKEMLIKYDKEDELKQKLAELDKVQAEQQNSVNQPKQKVKASRKA